METTEREKSIYRVTWAGSFVNFLLVVFKFMAGIVGHSAAMIADAVHSLSDFATDIVVLVFTRISNKPQDKSHDYGHGKYETLATAIIGIALFAVGVGICWNGLLAIRTVWLGGTLPAPGMLAFWGAVISIVSKEILYRYTIQVGRKVNSNAVIANAWHHRSDALSSVGTAVGIGGAILLGDNWRVLDPVAAVVVSIFIVKVAWEMVVPCANELMEQSLPEQTEREIEEILLSFPGVTKPHNLRTRRVGNNCAIDVHVRMDGNLTLHQSHETTRAMEQRLRELLGEGTFINIHVEPAKG